ncbi:hypothetical protein B0T19DRAFT_443804 [Cercophora scortea]|uniref:Uncharacterized protein n=1 Tax=Cercophora scortea TaxID=314031 RepID=A0AAE0IFS8_9PEZI|nr:hypothetical protein B0T19DRAFT_443804 [Cercophora scortea]
MSYQDYAELGKSIQPTRSPATPVPRLRSDRPYTGSMASFSVPRRATLHTSSSSSSSDSLSPSNSVSQKGGNSSPTGQWTGVSDRTPREKPKHLDLAEEKKTNLIELELPWRPFYLRRRILASFSAVFTAIAVSLGALYDQSHRNSGLCTTDQAGHYLSRYALTTLLVIATSIWNRTDYQARSTAPWIRLSKGPADAEKTLLLDYVTMSYPQAVVRAVKNKDFVVACTAAVALLLRLMVVISTGFITLTLVVMPSTTVPVMIETVFGMNGTDLANAGALAFFTMAGLQENKIPFPDGVSTRYAYQRFSADVPQGSTVKPTVDGFSAGLDCEVAQLTLGGIQYIQGLTQFNTTFFTAECNITMPVSSERFYTAVASGGNDTFYFSRLGTGSCGNTTRADDQRIVVVFGEEKLDSLSLPTDSSGGNATLNGGIRQSMQLLCKPIYTISRVDVTKKDDILVSVDPSPEQPNGTLSTMQAWDLAEAFSASYDTELAKLYANTTPWFYQPQDVNVDAAMYLALELQLKRAGSPPPLASLLDPVNLEGLANDYFQQYAALLASKALLRTNTGSPSTTATASTTSERLVVNPLVTKLVTILLGISVVLIVTAGLQVPKKGFLPRNPGTIMDTAALLANSRNILQALRGAGGADMATVRSRLAGFEYYTGVEAYERSASKGSGYFKILGGHSPQDGMPDYVEETDKFPHPSWLHPLQRVVAFLLVIGLIVGLDLSLQAAKDNGGLGDVGDDTYYHILWTVIPALVFSLLTMYFVAAAFTVRTLAPYAALRRGASFEESISLDLADRSTPMVLYQAARFRNLAVGGASLAALLAPLFIIFSASLFKAVTIPVTASCQLLTRDFFSQNLGLPDPTSCMDCQNGTVLSSLILDGNISYPSFTYEDMVFPSLTLENVPDDVDVPPELMVSATIPIARASMACRTFLQSDITTNLTSSTDSDLISSLRVILLGEAGGEDGPNDGSTITISTSPKSGTTGNLPALDPDAFFGTGAHRPISLGNGTARVSHWVWVWGQLQNAGTNQASVKSISALACNETMEQVNVATSFKFMGPGITIDPANPPMPDESTVFTTPIAIDGTLNYSSLIALSTPHLLDPFFTLLTTSRFATPLTDLGTTTPATLESVTAAITTQHKLIRAQVVSARNRRLTSKNPIPATTAAGNATTLAFPAALTITDLASGAQRRVIQDTTSTRVLQALLAAVLVAGAASWLAHAKPNTILPRSPTSIASVAALVADGNLFGLLGRGAEWLETSELHGFFKDGLHVTMGFQLGWEKVRRRRRDAPGGTGESSAGSGWGMMAVEKDQVFAVSAIRTGGWGGGENVGLGMQARVGLGQRGHVRDWGWRT